VINAPGWPHGFSTNKLCKQNQVGLVLESCHRTLPIGGKFHKNQFIGVVLKNLSNVV